ncbi:MAG TPA: hypothetical protein VJB99_04775 [Patescibacteria group bacterium]|nr:hypothetical protein [Patescibacteria group bacterium]
MMPDQMKQKGEEPVVLGIKDRVMTSLATGVVSPLPRWRICTRTTVLFLLTVVVTAVLALLTGALFFRLRVTAWWLLPQTGSDGLPFLFQMFPWGLALGVFVSAFAVQPLWRRYAIGYRFSVLSLFIGFLASLFFFGILLGRTPLHACLWEHGGVTIPFLDRFYGDGSAQKGRPIILGTVEVVSKGTSHEMIVRARDGRRWTVSPSGSGAIAWGGTAEVGSRVVVVGKKGEGIIRAVAIRTFRGDEQCPLPRWSNKKEE